MGSRYLAYLDKKLLIGMDFDSYILILYLESTNFIFSDASILNLRLA